LIGEIEVDKIVTRKGVWIVTL